MTFKAQKIIFFSLLLLFTLTCKEKSTEPQLQLDKRQIGTWNFVGFETTGDTILYPSPGDSIFLTITDTGRFSGKEQCKSGCGNDYYGTYKIGENNSFRIDTLGTTVLACFPSSCDAYYENYLDSMLTVKSFDVDTTSLHLYYGARNRKLIFTKK